MTDEQRATIERAYAMLEADAKHGATMAREGRPISKIREHAATVAIMAENLQRVIDEHVGASALLDRIDRSHYPRAKPLSRPRRT